MLLARPRLRSDECLVSYLVKVSEINGFKHVGHLLNKGGLAWKNNRIPVNHILSGEFDLDCYLSNLSLRAHDSRLRSICNSFRKRVDTPYLLAKYPKICPECVEEQGFCSYHWSVLPVVACTKHRKLLVDCDSSTSSRLSWYRKRLAQFDNSNDKIRVSDKFAMPEAVEISTYIESLIFNNVIQFSVPTVLSGLELREALTVIHLIAHFKARLVGDKFHPTGMENIRLASHYVKVWEDLNNWPESFYSLLDDYAVSPMSDKGSSGVNKHYRDLSERLHRQQNNKGIARVRKEFDI